MSTVYLKAALAAVVLVALIGAWVYVSSLHAEIDRQGVRIGQLTAEREEARRVAQANADAAEQARADAERQIAAVTDTLTTERRLRAQQVTIKEEIRRVPVPVNRCGVDPRIAHAVERLRPPGAADDHRGQAGAAHRAAGDAGLRAAAGAAGTPG